ncbi:hypothetical protein [Massilia sp. DD77]|uniref:hypothetical protein n=1 Tax=Massilia sp. DD77 TaxID=3109349 RepID=UPI002FFFB289
MATQEITRNIPADEVQEIMAEYRSLGAQVSSFKQSNGQYTVVAVFEESPHLAPLAMESAVEAEPDARREQEELAPPYRSSSFAELAPEYRRNFDICTVRPAHHKEIAARVARLRDNALRYKPLTEDTGIPWHFIAIIHMMESNTDFGTHLHNGDPLSARTVRVPAGRPVAGNPPFSWEESARDALEYEGFVGLDDWNVATMLYRWERFNGMGYRKQGIHSPYLWSYSNLYEKGRFVEDHKFNPDSVSKQCGAAVLLKELGRLA